MCYWSENHQILFASAEYLIGQLYPDQIFKVSGLSGKEHVERAKIRAFDWLEMRWNYSYIEYNSNVYYKEDIGPLMNLIDFAEDKALATKCNFAIFHNHPAREKESIASSPNYWTGYGHLPHLPRG